MRSSATSSRWPRSACRTTRAEPPAPRIGPETPMDFSIREEQQEVRDLARRILEDLVTNDRLKQVEASDEGIDRRAWEALADANLLGVAIPEDHGGSALGFHTLCVLLEEVGR